MDPPLELERTPAEGGPHGTYTELDPELPELKYGDGYRGDQGIQWSGVAADVVCAILCRCERWWGWYPERVAVGLRASMLRDGCRRCQ